MGNNGCALFVTRNSDRSPQNTDALILSGWLPVKRHDAAVQAGRELAQRAL